MRDWYTTKKKGKKRKKNMHGKKHVIVKAEGRVHALHAELSIASEI